MAKFTVIQFNRYDVTNSIIIKDIESDTKLSALSTRLQCVDGSNYSLYKETDLVGGIDFDDVSYIVFEQTI